MTPTEFIAKWGEPGGVPGPAFALNEEQGAQSHFLDLCELLDVPKPGSATDYRFEEKSNVIGGKTGYADVFKRGVFAWENKAPKRNLDTALKQLLTYSLALENPPILVVSDRLRIRIHTQFTGHPSQTFEVRLEQLDQPEQLALLRRIWLAPESFRPQQTNREITETAARKFAAMAQRLRLRLGQRPDAAAQALGLDEPTQVAHFLTQCVFCLFAEDVGLLPERLFERLLGQTRASPQRLSAALTQLLHTMRGGGLFGVDDVPHFNGGLFERVAVPELDAQDLAELGQAAALNWSAIDVSIFGTLFERGLDPAKRSQLGAHYTDPATIARLIDPVIRRPLLQEWERTAHEIQAFQTKSKRKGDAAHRGAQAAFVRWLERLRGYRVLDPACGSGNFLFLALKCLKDVELHTHLQAADLGLDRQADLVSGPHNVLGIEINAYAAELARVTVWIGELQWRVAHGYPFKLDPVLDALSHIDCRDALLQELGSDHNFAQQNLCSDPNSGPPVTEAPWPSADVVVGNPPFLGGSKKRGELGSAYFDALNTVFAGRVPGGADLVCYWFDKALRHMQSGGLQAAGLVATQAIRAGSNRKVLDAIESPLHIFDAWADEPWVNEGAAVRVSLVCFGAEERTAELNGQSVPHINADLTGVMGLDMTRAKGLIENKRVSFEGAQKNGPFDIPGTLARTWLVLPNPHSQGNNCVLKPYLNAADVTGRPLDSWMIDFHGYDEADAALFEAPFGYVRRVVKPVREAKREAYLSKKYWLLKRPAVELRNGISGLTRYIVTPRVAKHRFFVWMSVAFLPDSRLNVIARADDTTFGILSSRIHECWSLAQASMHGVGNDPTYNAKSCFETFPFPAGLTPADTAHQRTEALPDGAIAPAGLASDALKTRAFEIARAAHRLDRLRAAWLNPPEWTQVLPEVVPLGLARSPYPDRIVARPGFEKQLAQRTLTALYNQRPVWLAQAHHALDVAVAAAYGWPPEAADWPEAELLAHLLALNLAR